MRKIPTLFKRDPEDMARVTDEVHPECQWVLDGEGVATRKYDGTCVMLGVDGRWWARREVKPGKAAPPNWRKVDHDEVTGKSVGWEPIDQSPFAKFHAEALVNSVSPRQPGTYELLGPKIQGNPEGYACHIVMAHAEAEQLASLGARNVDDIKADVITLGWEGVVWHHPDGRMAKLKARDYTQDPS